MTDSTIEARLGRLESLFASAGEMMLQTAELSRQNAQQIERNTRQIERNAQLIDQNARQLSRLEGALAQLALQAATDRAEFEEFRRTTRAALEKIDRVLDYLVRRDSAQED